MDFSIEDSSELIPINKTQKYFKEVVSSYIIGNYRSAVVMLYSVVICDLIYKMQDLKDIYNDQAASAILAKIEKLQTTNPTSPEWENKLVDLIKDKMDLLSIIDHQNITYLKRDRNLSAHPVITNMYELYNPNKETVRAHIRNMLEGVLIKPALLSKKIIDSLLDDTASKKELLNQLDDFKQYLNSKYFSRMNDAVQKELFKVLWKFTFRNNTDIQCEENRVVNYNTLHFLYKKNKEIFKDMIRAETEYFSEISSNSPMTLLFCFLCQERSVYELLNDAAKSMIRGTYNSNKVVESTRIYRILGWFIVGDFAQHFKELELDFEKYIPLNHKIAQSFHILFKSAIECGKQEEIIMSFIRILGASGSYSDAGERYLLFIAPYFKNFSSENLIFLLKLIDNNNQIWGSYDVDYAKMKVACSKLLPPDFSYDDYPNIKHIFSSEESDI